MNNRVYAEVPVGTEARWDERLKKVAQHKPEPQKPG